MSPQLILTVILLLLTLCVIVLGCVLLSRLKKTDTGKGDLEETERRIAELSRSVRDEFAANRSELSAGQRSQREELNASLDVMSRNLAEMKKENAETRGEMTETISKKLDEIRLSSAEQSSRQLSFIGEAMERLQAGNEKKLEQMRETVDEKLNSTLKARLDSSFQSVSEQLEKVYTSLGEMKVLSTGVTDNVTSLNRILTNVKARGTWAEVQLESLLNQTIPGMFDRNVHTVPSSKDVVEFAVRIPSGEDTSVITYLPIDSKFPLEDYTRLCAAADAGNAQAVTEHRKSLERSILSFAKDVSKYINEPVTTPFAIMYLATEGLYSEIISSPNAIAERVQRECGVMIAGPSTITALLNSLSMGFRAMAINEKAKEVRTLLAAAKAQYDKFGDILEKARKKISEAGKSLDEAQSRNSIIQKKLKTVELMEDKRSSAILGITEE